MIKNNKLYSWDPKKGKFILCGAIAGNSLFRKVNSRHFLRIVQGYGIQEIAFLELLEKGVKYIVLKNEETRRDIQAPVERWIENGKVMDFGNGKQRFLSLKYMDQRPKPKESILKGGEE